MVFSVTLSAALFFASIALSGTLKNTFMERIKKYIGTSNIIIHSNRLSPHWLFNLDKALAMDEFEYVVGTIEITATYKHHNETVNIDLYGYYLDDLQTMNPYILESEFDLHPFQGKKIIVSKKTAEKYNLTIGSNIEVKINNAKHRFKIVAIAQPLGVFQEDGRTNIAIVPRDTLGRLFNASRRVSTVYLKTKKHVNLETAIEKLSKIYNRYTVREPISRAEIEHFTQSITTPFLIMLVLVLFTSIFIIYSSFKVITRERLPIIGTFRSIGATHLMTDLLMFAESIFYGFIGGILGCLLGIGFLYIMNLLMTPEWMRNVKTSLDISLHHIFITFTLSIALPLISSALPIIKVSKKPVKEIVLNEMERPKKASPLRFAIGLINLLIGMVIPQIAPKPFALALVVGCMLLIGVGMILLIPLITSIFIKLFEKIYYAVLGNEGFLAAKNLRENKSILNNISLLALGISSLLMINTVSFSVIREVANFFKDGQFDIWMGYYRADRKFESILRSVNGVSGVYGVYSGYSIELSDSKEKIHLIHGIDSNKHLEYWNVNVEGDLEPTKIIQLLDVDRNIILSSILKDKLGVNLGDSISLKMNNTTRVYKIIGFFHSLMSQGGYALVSNRFLKNDLKLNFYDDIFIKTTLEPALVADNIKRKFARHEPWVQTMSQITKEELDSQQQMFALLRGFSVIALIIGIFGVLNNLVISFIERKRSLAMMRSVGMSKQQTLKIIMIESFTGGIIGSTTGIITGTLLIHLVPFILKAMGFKIPMQYSVKEYLIAFVAGILITVAASISPALKSSKLNIIEAIKYE
ncbi:MAG TPA: FtsX-like permease family protein [Bacillota bacterium]|nr:FtsX-like permease family protein [Bacillota bacterium]HPO96416.1 FtsX-like permease family protein [Bacillota bacterium]